MKAIRFALLLLLLPALLAACGGDSTQLRAVAEPHGKEGEVAAPTVLVSSNDAIGSFLTDNTGRTLYTYSGDVRSSQRSAVPVEMMSRWPAFSLTAETFVYSANGRAPDADQYGFSENNPNEVGGVLDLLTPNLQMDANDAGRLSQVTYNGLPLYYFAGDDRAGDVNGHNVDGFAAAAP
jgi:predicted lipoprotein with Yx(FWY)xxD motif